MSSQLQDNKSKTSTKTITTNTEDQKTKLGSKLLNKTQGQPTSGSSDGEFTAPIQTEFNILNINDVDSSFDESQGFIEGTVQTVKDSLAVNALAQQDSVAVIEKPVQENLFQNELNKLVNTTKKGAEATPKEVIKAKSALINKYAKEGLPESMSLAEMKSWINMHAEIKGSSKSFTALVEKFNAYTEATGEEQKTALQALLDETQKYLKGHKKTPITQKGKQRVQMCRLIEKLGERTQLSKGFLQDQRTEVTTENYDKLSKFRRAALGLPLNPEEGENKEKNIENVNKTIQYQNQIMDIVNSEDFKKYIKKTSKTEDEYNAIKTQTNVGTYVGGTNDEDAQTFIDMAQSPELYGFKKDEDANPGDLTVSMLNELCDYIKQARYRFFFTYALDSGVYDYCDQMGEEMSDKIYQIHSYFNSDVYKAQNNAIDDTIASCMKMIKKHKNFRPNGVPKNEEKLKSADNSYKGVEEVHNFNEMLTQGNIVYAKIDGSTSKAKMITAFNKKYSVPINELKEKFGDEIDDRDLMDREILSELEEILKQCPEPIEEDKKKKYNRTRKAVIDKAVARFSQKRNVSVHNDIMENPSFKKYFDDKKFEKYYKEHKMLLINSDTGVVESDFKETAEKFKAAYGV